MQQLYLRPLFYACFLLLVPVLPGWAQQNPQYTQYVFNSMLINPAYAGSKGLLNTHVMYRSQWSGLEGSPKTGTLSADGVALGNRLGWGGYLVQDNIGAQSQTAVYGNASVKVKTGETAVLRFGVAPGVVRYGLNRDKIRTATANDPAFARDQQTHVKPDLKAGLYYHTQKFFTGLSASNLIQINHNVTVKTRAHLYFTSGYVLTLSDYLKLKPSFLLKDDFRSPTSADFNAFLLIDEKLWLGVTHRRGFNIWQDTETDLELVPAAAMAYMLEFYPQDKFRLGYAYDAAKSGLNTGTHEISLGYYFIKPQGVRNLNPRYF